MKEKAEQDTILKFQQIGKDKLGKSNAKGKSYDRKRRKAKDDLLQLYGSVNKVGSLLLLSINYNSFRNT